jgi:hypothetical protein
MSFLADPALLYVDGHAYARLAPESAQGGLAKVVGAATVGSVLAAGIGSYLNKDWAKPLWKPFGAKSGRDFMLNWPVLSFNHKRNDTATHVVAAAILASYPLWWYLGWDHGRRARPSSSS